jgi:hypothetical protein
MSPNYKKTFFTPSVKRYLFVVLFVFFGVVAFLNEADSKLGYYLSFWL